VIKNNQEIKIEKANKEKNSCVYELNKNMLESCYILQSANQNDSSSNAEDKTENPTDNLTESTYCFLDKVKA
jgi:hypothetical protein